VCGPFSSACALESIARFLPKESLWDDSEKLSFEPKAHQPLAELIFLSPASEKEEIGKGSSK
jgi:hypothetical protein